MTDVAALFSQPKLVYVDHRGIQSHRFTPGSLTLRQFDEYVRLLQQGTARDIARVLAAATPKR